MPQLLQVNTAPYVFKPPVVRTTITRRHVHAMERLDAALSLVSLRYSPPRAWAPKRRALAFSQRGIVTAH